MNALMKKLRAAVSRTSWNALRQRGSILVLTAFALPVILAGIGFAVDAGNIYMHKARLQNAADAAALGGAKVGMDGTIDITKFDTNDANDKALELIWTDMKEEQDLAASAPEALEETWNTWSYRVATGGNAVTSMLGYHKDKTDPTYTRYYTVELQQDVPLIFVKYFLPKDSVSISAASYTKFVQQYKVVENKKAPFTDLFVYSKRFTNVHGINNPDNHNTPGQIISTYDGHASYTDKNAITEYQQQNNSPDGPVDRFFTSRAKDLSVNEAIKKTEAKYDENGEVAQKGYWSKAEYRDYDMNSYWNDRIVPLLAEESNVQRIASQNISSQDLESGKDVLLYDLSDDTRVSVQNLKLTIDHEISGDVNKPVYLVIKSGRNRPWWKMAFGVLNVDMQADTRRPLVICLEPDELNHSSQIHIETHGHNYRGIVYAPVISDNGNDDEGIHINTQDGGTFSGSLVGSFINLKQGGYFKYEALDLNGGGSNSTSGNTTTVVLTGFDRNLIADSNDINFKE